MALDLRTQAFQPGKQGHEWPFLRTISILFYTYEIDLVIQSYDCASVA